MKAPEFFKTERLLLRRPVAGDAAAIFERYASVPKVCTYLAWPRHRSIDDTAEFLEFSDFEWRRWGAGPYLIFSLSGDTMYGSTGLAFESADCASTGYVLASDAWGRGIATEAVIAMRELAAGLNVRRLYAACHTDHRVSQRVLEKADFKRDGILHEYCEFPNLEPGVLRDVLCYAWARGADDLS